MKPLPVIVILATVVLSAVEKDESHKPELPSALVGGEDVGAEFPFVGQVWVLLDADENEWSLCTGTLIHRRWILTAAHCFEGDTVRRDIAVCMRPDGCESDQYLRASDFSIRPEWVFEEDDDGKSSWSESQFDQALIRLRTSSRETPVPISTTTQGLAFNGVLVGWGLVEWNPEIDEDDYKRADTLQKLPVILSRIPTWDILVSVSLARVIFDAYTGYSAGGDSGGPSLVWTVSGWSLVGVGATSSSERGYSTYGAVTGRMTDWIMETLGDYGDEIPGWREPPPPPVSGSPGRAGYNWNSNWSKKW